jgi:hypothetical protein
VGAFGADGFSPLPPAAAFTDFGAGAEQHGRLDAVRRVQQ